MSAPGKASSDGKTVAHVGTYGWLVPQQGASAGLVFPLGAMTLVGADATCHVRLDGLAPQHAEITMPDESAWRIRALGAAPVTVDGDPVTGEPWEIGDGASIALGPVRLVFKCLRRE